MQRPCIGLRLEQLRRASSSFSPSSERWGHKKRPAAAKKTKGGMSHKTSTLKKCSNFANVQPREQKVDTLACVTSYVYAL